MTFEIKWINTPRQDKNVSSQANQYSKKMALDGEKPSITEKEHYLFQEQILQKANTTWRI